MGKRKQTLRSMTNSQANNVFSKKCKVGAIYKNSFAQSDEIDSRQVLRDLKEMFKNKIEDDVIELVFNDFKNDVNQTLEVLLKLGEEKEIKEQPTSSSSHLPSSGAENQSASSCSLFKAQANLIPFQDPDIANKIDELLKQNAKLLIIMRGLPGSGKSTLAQQLWKSGGTILSTDDFFMKNGSYQFDPNLLHEAHSWNRQRAIQSMRDHLSPVIVDNTNIEEWEIRPYVIIGLRFQYQMLLVEPDTPWKFNVNYLAKNNTHGISKQKLKQMLERYSKNLSLDFIVEKVQSTPSLPNFVDNKSLHNTDKSKSTIKTFPASNSPPSRKEATCNKAAFINHRSSFREKSKSLETLEFPDASFKDNSKEVSKSINSLFELFGVEFCNTDLDAKKQEGKTHGDSSSPEMDSLSLLSSHSSSQGWEAVTDEFTWEVNYHHPQHQSYSNWDTWDQPALSTTEKGPKPPRSSRKTLSSGSNSLSKDEIMNINDCPTHFDDDVELISLNISSQKTSCYLVNASSQTSAFYFEPSHVHCLDSSVIILDPKKYCPSPFAIEVVPKEGKCDKSTITEEIINENTYEEKLNKLQVKFPHVEEEEISHILKICKQDFSWAKNILNDSSHLKNTLVKDIKSNGCPEFSRLEIFKISPLSSDLPCTSSSHTLRQSKTDLDISDEEGCQNESFMPSLSSSSLVPAISAKSYEREQDDQFNSIKISNNGSTPLHLSTLSIHYSESSSLSTKDATPSGNGISNGALDNFGEREGDSLDEILTYLQILFPQISLDKISHTLKHCKKANGIFRNLADLANNKIFELQKSPHFDKNIKEELLKGTNRCLSKNSSAFEPCSTHNNHVLDKDQCICDVVSSLIRSMKLEEINLSTKYSQTEPQYFNISYAENVDPACKTLLPRPYITSSLPTLPKFSNSKINKGTLTDEAKLSYLQVLFPHFNLEEILHIYKVCNYNITWVTNILCDSIKNNKGIPKEIYKNYRYPRKLLPLRATNHDRTVKKILDTFNIDMNFVCSEEELIISGSEKGLQEGKLEVRNRSLSDLNNILGTEVSFLNNNKDEETTTDSSTEANLSVCLVGKVFNFNLEYFDDDNSPDEGDYGGLKDQPDFLNSPLLITESLPGSPVIRESPLNEKDSLQLSLTPSLAKVLINNFGRPISSMSPDSISPEELIVDLDAFGMELLFSLWTASLKKKARSYQSPSLLRAQEPASSSLTLESQDVPLEEYQDPPCIPKDTESFQEIMDMELAKELDREQRLAARRRHMISWGTWHSQREELYQQFPGVDQDVLDELYDSTGGDLKKCTKLLDDPIHCKSLFDSSATVASSLQGDATYHFLRKQECHKKAEHFFSQGLNNVAFYNSQLSQYHHKKLKELSLDREEYSHLLLSPVTLDLHGLFVPEAIRTLRTFLRDKQIELLRTSYKKLVVFAVTGIGRHSIGRPKLLPAVANFLTSNKFNFEEDKPGVLRITIKRTHI